MSSGCCRASCRKYSPWPEVAFRSSHGQTSLQPVDTNVSGRTGRLRCGHRYRDERLRSRARSCDSLVGDALVFAKRGSQLFGFSRALRRSCYPPRAATLQSQRAAPVGADPELCTPTRYWITAFERRSLSARFLAVLPLVSANPTTSTSQPLAFPWPSLPFPGCRFIDCLPRGRAKNAAIYVEEDRDGTNCVVIIESVDPVVGQRGILKSLISRCLRGLGCRRVSQLFVRP